MEVALLKDQRVLSRIASHLCTPDIYRCKTVLLAPNPSTTMRYLCFLYPALLASSALVGIVEGVRKPANSVLLSNVQSLTLRKDLKTSHRRVPAIPQVSTSNATICSLTEHDFSLNALAAMRKASTMLM